MKTYHAEEEELAILLAMGNPRKACLAAAAVGASSIEASRELFDGDWQITKELAGELDGIWASDGGWTWCLWGSYA